MAFLEETGLSYLLSKIKTAYAAKDHIHSGITTAGDGAAFTVTAPGITELVAGVSVNIIPHVSSTTTTPTLNVNNLGAKSIRRKISSGTSATVPGLAVAWLPSGKPINCVYDGTYWIATDLPKPNAGDLYGSVPVQLGGWYINSSTTDENKAEALEALVEIGVATASEVNSSVKTTVQTLTEAQQAQARENIGAASQEDVDAFSSLIVPDYWTNELETKASAIQTAMEQAGRNKAAFLWYTDAHWPDNAKVSPAILKYMSSHTPMNKINFGGDIVGDPSAFTHNNIEYVYEWRNLIAGLPNHHSVIGNHDVNQSTTDNTNIAYAFLIAPEENSDMVMGGDLYYYIDAPCEKTRYLYLSSGKWTLTDDETAFIIEALNSAPVGWHIVVISHIWFMYTSADEPSVGNMSVYMQKALNLFDDYNARNSGSITMNSAVHEYDFTNANGRVEFCIGGHIHIDLDLTSTDGIPVIMTASDTNQNRSVTETEDSGTLGTTTEAAVYGIIADFTTRKINVIGIGRGGSREITMQSLSNNLADPTSSDWLTGYRLSTSSTSQLAGAITTNYIPCKYQDVIYIKGLDVRTISTGNARYHMCGADKSLIIADAGYTTDLITQGYASVDGDVIRITAGMIAASAGSFTNEVVYQRFCGTLMAGYTDADVVITVNQPITE